MRYAMLVYETEAGVKARNDPEYQAAYKAYIEAIYGTGVAVGGSGLQDAATTATTFRIINGERQIQDGPYPDTKEQLAGFFLIDVPDLDKALEWAARCPSTARGGIIELRPALEQPSWPRASRMEGCCRSCWSAPTILRGQRTHSPRPSWRR